MEGIANRRPRFPELLGMAGFSRLHGSTPETFRNMTPLFKERGDFRRYVLAVVNDGVDQQHFRASPTTRADRPIWALIMKYQGYQKPVVVIFLADSERAERLPRPC